MASLDEPETDALEWKGALDLTNRKSRFDLSRHLLGFGNRTVQQAQHAFDGYAYRLAGVEPGNLCGVAIPDPADLENALSSFIAHGHLAWRLHRVDVDAVTVAVIEVQPPRDGDRICCLQHSYDASQAVASMSASRARRVRRPRTSSVHWKTATPPPQLRPPAEPPRCTSMAMIS